MATRKKDDPTVTSDLAEPTPGAGAAPAIEDADDAAVNFRYRDMPDDRKPSPSTVAQEQLTAADEDAS